MGLEVCGGGGRAVGAVGGGGLRRTPPPACTRRRGGGSGGGGGGGMLRGMGAPVCGGMRRGRREGGHFHAGRGRPRGGGACAAGLDGGGGMMGGAGGFLEVALLGYAVLLSAVPLMMPVLGEEEVQEADRTARYVLHGWEERDGKERGGEERGGEQEDGWGAGVYASVDEDEDEDRLLPGDDVSRSWGEEEGPLGSGEGLKWALMAILSVMPGLNWAPWVLAAVDADRASSRYAAYAALYAAPWVLASTSSPGVGQGLSGMAFATVLLGVAHVQVEQAAVFRRGGALGLKAAQARLPAALGFALRGRQRVGKRLEDGLRLEVEGVRRLVEREGRRKRLEEIRAGAEKDAAERALEGREEAEEMRREEKAFDRWLRGGQDEEVRERRRGGGSSWLDDD